MTWRLRPCISGSWMTEPCKRAYGGVVSEKLVAEYKATTVDSLRYHAQLIFKRYPGCDSIEVCGEGLTCDAIVFRCGHVGIHAPWTDTAGKKMLEGVDSLFVR